MSRIRTGGAACLAIVGMLAAASAAFSQMDGRQGGGGQGAMVMGEVTGIDNASLTVTTENGSTERLTITSSTSFVQESPADKSALAVGETVVVIGQPEG